MICQLQGAEVDLTCEYEAGGCIFEITQVATILHQEPLQRAGLIKNCCQAKRLK